MKPLLSILIPTVLGREHDFNALVIMLSAQIRNGGFEEAVEIAHICDNKEITIGEKREMLYKKANGIYSVQWDDDDAIHPEGVALILWAIKDGADCITYQERCLMNGVEYKSNHSIQYADWEGDGQKELHDGFHFHRTPFMKSVIKTEIARSVPIPHIRFGEDHQWAQALKPHLSTETHIHDNIYHYIHNSTDPTERYGLDRN